MAAAHGCSMAVLVVCLLAAPRVQLSASAGNGWPHNALPISCHFGYCKALLFLSLTHASTAVASVLTFMLFNIHVCLQSGAIQHSALTDFDNKVLQPNI